MHANDNETMTGASEQESIAPLTDHLYNLLPVTSQAESSSPESDAVGKEEEEFNRLCKGLKSPIQIIPKKDIVWNSNDSLRFFHSLAFVLRSESLTSVAVSSFKDIQGGTQLYIASNQTMTESEQKEITDIITLFLELKSAKEIDAKVIPRQLAYIIKQLDKITVTQINDFLQRYPGQLSASIQSVLNGSKSFEEIYSLMKLIYGDRKVLRLMKSGTMENTSEATKRIAYHLCKMIRILEEIDFVLKKVKLHQADVSLQSLSKPFQFIENKNNCHAEIAILKAAVDYCTSKTLYIGVSKRPCYCCSILFKAVTECQSLKFNISIVTTHGKLYSNWNKIEGFLDKEFSQVWAIVVQKRYIIENSNVQLGTDDNSSFSGSSSDEDNSRFS